MGGSDTVLSCTGPRLITPPALPLTRQEFDRWETGLLSEGFTTGWEREQPGPATSDIELLLGHYGLPNIRVDLTVGGGSDGSGRSFRVRVENRSGRVIRQVSVVAAARCEFPQPHPMLPGLGPRMFTIHEPALIPLDGVPGTRDIPAGGELEFGMAPDQLDAVRSRAAALSIENHWLSVRMYGLEILRVCGEDLADLLTEADETA